MSRKNGNWTIKNSKEVFANEFFKVIEDDVIAPDGRDAKYATIDIKVGVTVLPIDEEGVVYLMRQFRYALERSSIECIAGTVEDEDLVAAARRESKEELGIEAREWSPAGRIDMITGISNASTELFIARGLTFSRSEREATEDLEPIKMPLGEARDKVMKGEITHAETCVLILRASAEI